ncbi:MAG: glycogen-binding domain-containing protein [Candidatus Krumholzibacteriota bacterium]
MFAKVSRVLVLTVAIAAVLLTTGPPGAALAAAPEKGEDGIVFSYHAPKAQAVFLAGDFNNWNAQDLAMVRQDSGDWTLTIALDSGSYEYKFIADGNWLEDPDNPEKKSDPFGGSNSVVTVGSDGAVVAAAGAVAPVATGEKTDAAVPDDFSVGAPRAVDGGILFTYRDPGVGTVNLAGSFNGWNADDIPLTNDGKGNWAVVHSLDSGEHEYKFVVDGAWFADPENPDTKADPYGGANSLVIVDDGGQLIAAPETADGDGDGHKPNTNLNARLYLGGRYLTRFEFAKNVETQVGDTAMFDPRYRLQRPSQSVDLNFEAEVSDIAATFMRIRLDSDQNIIQNNIAGFLDEANLTIEPSNFKLKAYWNQEVYTGEDLLLLGGNTDLPGTIFHDHLDYGKGSAGALFEADPVGVKTVLFFANVHNHDYYGDPKLFDNTGEDKVGLRLSRKFGPVEIGTPVWLERSVVELDLGDIVGLADTGIPALNEYLKTDDDSNMFNTETRNFNFGLDLRFDLTDKLMFGAQGNYVDIKQAFVAGNHAGLDNNWAQIDVPFLERDRRMYMGQVDFRPTENMEFSLKHIVADMNGADPDQRRVAFEFRDQNPTNNRIYFTIEDSPAAVEADSTDLTWDWHKDDLDLGVWLRRVSRDWDYESSDLTVPEDESLTSRTEEIYKASLMAGLGNPGDFLGHGEIEFAYVTADAGVAAKKIDTYEMIFRYDRDLSRNTGLIADLRFIQYDFEGNDSNGELIADSPDYFAPFAGFRYTPIRKLELVLAYGVDPLEYSIDYEGRHLGRWWFRQNYLFNNSDATQLDAENYLSKADVFTLRAQLLF